MNGKPPRLFRPLVRLLLAAGGGLLIAVGFHLTKSGSYWSIPCCLCGCLQGTIAILNENDLR